VTGEIVVRFRKRISVLAAVASSIFMCSGCGLFDTGEPAPEQVYGNPRDLEQVTITVGALRTLDTAPLHLAVSHGLFKKEGLNVKIDYINAGPVGVDRLAAGTLDLTFTSYPPIYLAEHNGIGSGVGSFKIVADATSLLPGNSVIAVPHDSQLHEVTDLRGKTVAVVGFNTMAHLLVLNTLRVNDIGPDDVTYVQAKFDDTPALLASGSIDAAFLTEPLLTIAREKYGVKVLQDTYNGANEGIALCGYATTGTWVKAHPDTLAAFSRAMQRATQLAKDKPRLVYDVLPTYVPGLTAGEARIINYTQYEPRTSPERLQRVATLMSSFGMFDDKATRDDPWSMTHMIVPPVPLTRQPAN
jgi:NitT/TauT family transport system substrate-binding protein